MHTHDSKLRKSVTRMRFQQKNIINNPNDYWPTKIKKKKWFIPNRWLFQQVAESCSKINNSILHYFRHFFFCYWFRRLTTPFYFFVPAGNNLCNKNMKQLIENFETAIRNKIKKRDQTMYQCGARIWQQKSNFSFPKSNHYETKKELTFLWT